MAVWRGSYVGVGSSGLCELSWGKRLTPCFGVISGIPLKVKYLHQMCTSNVSPDQRTLRFIPHVTHRATEPRSRAGKQAPVGPLSTASKSTQSDRNVHQWTNLCHTIKSVKPNFYHVSI